MTVDAQRQSKKRKQSLDEGVGIATFHRAVDLEMLSDEEHQEELASDDGEVDEFPEIDARSDSDEDGVEDSDGDEEESGDEPESDEAGSDDSELQIFPKAKTVISDITGHPKRVYPEIEPEYDSDSSTEEASWLLFSPELLLTPILS
jgi:ribosome biogenesis protein ERB1